MFIFTRDVAIDHDEAKFDSLGLDPVISVEGGSEKHHDGSENSLLYFG
jgi:hypothetical protein